MYLTSLLQSAGHLHFDLNNKLNKTEISKAETPAMAEMNAVARGSPTIMGVNPYVTE